MHHQMPQTEILNQVEFLHGVAVSSPVFCILGKYKIPSGHPEGFLRYVLLSIILLSGMIALSPSVQGKIRTVVEAKSSRYDKSSRYGKSSM